jgi:hypothetical protein
MVAAAHRCGSANRAGRVDPMMIRELLPGVFARRSSRIGSSGGPSAAWGGRKTKPTRDISRNQELSESTRLISEVSNGTRRLPGEAAERRRERWR